MDEKNIQEIILEIRLIQEKILLLLEHVNVKLNLAEKEDWLDNNDLIRALKVTDKTLYRWRRNGKLDFGELGGKYYYSRNKIAKIIAEREAALGKKITL